MATKLFLRNTTNNGITDTGDGVVYDLSTTAGSSADTGVVNTSASGTNIQWTKTAGGSSMAWISGRVPSGGFTLTSVDVSAWLEESHTAANAKGRFRIYKYTPGTPTITELGGSPFDDDKVELSTSATEDTWTANVTDTAFAENDRILVRFFITNNGTMGGSRTCTLTFNAADAATGDSYVTLAENVTFKADTTPLTPSLYTDTDTFFTPTVSHVLNASLFSDGDTFHSATVTPGAVGLTASLFENTNIFGPGSDDTFWGADVTLDGGTLNLAPSLFTDSDTFFTHTLSSTYALTASLFSDDDTFFSSTITVGAVNLSPSLFSDTDTFFSATVSSTYALTPSLFTDADSFYTATVSSTYGLSPSLFTDTDTFFSATVTPGTITLTPSLFTDSDSFYTHAISVGAVTLTASLFTNTNTFYSALVTGGGQPVNPGLFTNSNTFYGATVRVYPLAPFKKREYLIKGLKMPVYRTVRR